MSSFKDLIVWQKAHSLVLDIYKITEQFPGNEQFGLTSQIRRASVSVSSNIVEGYERGSSKELNRFLLISRGSVAELQNQLLIAKDLGYIKRADFDKLAEKSVEVNKLLNGYRKGIARNSSSRAS